MLSALQLLLLLWLTKTNSTSYEEYNWFSLTIAILEDYADKISQFICILKHQIEWPHLGIHKFALVNTDKEEIGKLNV